MQGEGFDGLLHGLAWSAWPFGLTSSEDSSVAASGMLLVSAIINFFSFLSSSKCTNASNTVSQKLRQFNLLSNSWNAANH